MIQPTPQTAATDSAPAAAAEDEVVQLIARIRKWLKPDEIERRAQVPYRTLARWEKEGPPPPAATIIRLQNLEKELFAELKNDFGKVNPN